MPYVPGQSGTSIPCSTTDSRLTSTSVTSATTFSQAMEPLSTPLKTLKAVLDATSSSSDKSDSEERAAIVTETGKGKAAMKVSAVISGEKCTHHIFQTIIKIDSSTDVELHAAPIMGHGKNKTATGSAKVSPITTVSRPVLTICFSPLLLQVSGSLMPTTMLF
jgi:hypothetical protein